MHFTICRKPSDSPDRRRGTGQDGNDTAAPPVSASMIAQFPSLAASRSANVPMPTGLLAHPCPRRSPFLATGWAMAWRRLGTLLLGWMLALSAWAGDGVLVQRLPSGLPLTGQVKMLADPDGTLTLDAVRAAGPARWYLAGQGALFVMVIALVLVNQGVLHAPFVLANGLQIGIVAELVVFAIALSRRIRALQEEQAVLGRRAADLAEAAATDPLTGLANRSGLARAAQPLLGGDGEHALMLLDLDRFKPVNDRHGHEWGDRVLQTVARRLQQQVRETDTVARLGGDEFVILLRDQRDAQLLLSLGERLALAVAEPIRNQGVEVAVGGSIGIARYPRDGRQLADLLRSADRAMYRAKRSDRRAALAEPADGASPAPAAAA